MADSAWQDMPAGFGIFKRGDKLTMDHRILNAFMDCPFRMYYGHAARYKKDIRDMFYISIYVGKYNLYFG